MKKIQRVWHAEPSGILSPAGSITDLQNRFKTSYLKVKSKAEEIEALFSDNGLTVPHNCDLADIIANSKILWERWFTNKTTDLEMIMLFKLLHLDRMADSILALKEERDRAKYLKGLFSGTVNFFKRERSHAKDILWELEVWSNLRRRLSTVHLQEPPDIVVEFDNARIGIACKKLYSEKHVQNVLSQAVHQIEDTFEFGIVAVNLDDFIPEDKLLRAPNTQRMTETLLELNSDFIRRHERHFLKYLSTGRLISAMVSTSVIADIENASPKFNNASQWTIWTIPGLDEKKDRQLRRFYDVVMDEVYINHT
ncbi:MAG: hypothetical protein MPW15_11510 [Candidatus Manganitrophus sp.]|nr:hypothetical protein [Candidatus Manganitrophus sp.]